MEPNSNTWETHRLIRKKERGVIDYEKSLQIIEELSALNTFHPDHNFLLDHRETQSFLNGIDDIMNVTLEFVRFMPSFSNKIATVISKDPESLSVAQRFQACMVLYDYNFRFFTDIEKAMVWLSDEEDDSASG